MKDELLTIHDVIKLHSIFKKPHGEKLAGFLFRLAGIHKINDAYNSTKHLSGPDVENKMIEGLGIRKKVHNIEVIDRFEGKPFITVSNHPYGHIDGIMLIGSIAERRQDFKVLVNWILGLVDSMQDHFIEVNPYESGSLSERSSLSGIKKSISHLKGQHPLGLFPAGAISKNKITKIEDRDWQPSVLKLIKKAKLPVIPVFISGTNSPLFNFLDLIDWRLRTLRLPHELTNKKEKTIHLMFGEPIMPNEQAACKDTDKLGAYLKEKTYSLKKTLKELSH